MFCPANEAFQNITEKTKLIAQKCSQQIRIATAATLSPSQSSQQPQKQYQTTLEVPNNPKLQKQQQSHYMSISLPTSPAGYKNFIDIDNVDGNICSCNTSNGRLIVDDNNKYNSSDEETTFVSESNIIIAETNKNLNAPYWKRRTSDTNVNATKELFNNNCNTGIQGTQSLSKAATTKLGSNFNKYFYSCTGGTLRNLAKKYQQNKNSSSNNQFNNTTSSTVKWYVKQPTWRFWGEERDKDVIFTVYLKKVRYHRPTMVTNQDSDDEISHLEWETVRVRFVKAASLPRLVEALATDDGELESTFINVFLSTYRTFSNAKEILDLLFKRYDTLTELILRMKDKHINNISSSSRSSSPSSSIQNSHHSNPFHNNHHHENGDDISSNTHIVNVNDDPEDLLAKHEQHKKTLVSALHVWLDGFPEDWNEENLRHLLTFSSKRLPNSELHMKVLHRYERCIRLQAQQNHHHHHHHQHGGGGGGGSGGSSSSNSTLPWMEQPYPDFAEQFSGLCLAPAFRGPPSHLLQAYRFPHIQVKHFAEQLTRMDMELFKRLIPHQCLGATWGRRDKHEADTVVATVNQFNAVSYRVISTILIEPKLKPQERAVNIATWIEIGQELRLLKNFSSLKAIISGLQSNAIFRLKKTWNALPKEKQELFEELARIFSKDMSEILMREGTAKIADTVGENDKQLQKALQKQDIHTSHGTIPYLGAFLSELTYIDNYYSSYVEENNLINFSKRRKEFEVLAQIKLLQGAANTYNLREDHHFDRWFASMLVLDEREAHALSCQLEIPVEPRKLNNNNNINNNNTNNNNNSNNNSNNINNNHHNSSSSNNSTSNLHSHRKTDSIASNSSSGAGSHTFYCEINNGSNSISFTESNYSRNNSLDRDTIPPNNSSSIMSASSSISNLSIDSSNSGGQKSLSNNSKTKIIQNNGKLSATGIVTNDGTPIINAQLVQSPGQKNSTPDFYIIRVTLELDNNEEMTGVVLYKSIMLGNNEHTPQVIKNAMVKLDIEGDPDQFTLAQVLPDKELVMPANANVYYAVNTQYNLNFILRRNKNKI